VKAIAGVFLAKAVRTLCYGFLGILLPLYLSDLGVSAAGVGAALTMTLIGSAALTWAVRWPAERLGARSALLALTGLSALAAGLLLVSRQPALVVLAAMLGNLAVGAGETGPFLTVEQVVITRATSPGWRTAALSAYNLLGYAAAALGAVLVGAATPRVLFIAFLGAAGVQALAYALLPRVKPPARAATGGRPSSAIIRRLAALFALDSFAGGFVLQSLVAYYLHARFALTLGTLGRVFFVAQALTAASLLVAPALARRYGLLTTMVLSHLLSNVFLVAIAAAPAPAIAVALLLARQALSQIDVPTRQAYVMAVVDDAERERAASVTTLWRTISQAVSPAVTGWVMQAVALSTPFVLGGGLKIVYDLLLYRTFRDVKERVEG